MLRGYGRPVAAGYPRRHAFLWLRALLSLPFPIRAVQSRSPIADSRPIAAMPGARPGRAPSRARRGSPATPSSMDSLRRRSDGRLGSVVTSRRRWPVCARTSGRKARSRKAASTSWQSLTCGWPRCCAMRISPRSGSISGSIASSMRALWRPLRLKPRGSGSNERVCAAPASGSQPFLASARRMRSLDISGASTGRYTPPWRSCTVKRKNKPIIRHRREVALRSYEGPPRSDSMTRHRRIVGPRHREEPRMALCRGSKVEKQTHFMLGIAVVLARLLALASPVAKRDRLSSVGHGSRFAAMARTAPATFSRKRKRQTRQERTMKKQTHFERREKWS